MSCLVLIFSDTIQRVFADKLFEKLQLSKTFSMHDLILTAFKQNSCIVTRWVPQISLWYWCKSLSYSPSSMVTFAAGFADRYRHIVTDFIKKMVASSVTESEARQKKDKRLKRRRAIMYDTAIFLKSMKQIFTQFGH